MHTRKHWMLAFGLLAIAGILLAACQPTEVEVPVTVVVEKEVQLPGEEVTVVEEVQVVVTATPEPAPPPEPRTLVICQGQEPETLYTYGGSMLAMSHVLEAVYDGPIDTNSFSYQAVIIEKMPSLSDGDAVINAVSVSAGDQVVDDGGSPVTLEEGVTVRPAGCRSSDCAVEYDGSDLEMDQMAVTFVLLDGLTWSDGEPLTSDDSIYSFELAADPDTPAGKYTLDRTASYEAVDDLTLVWTGLPGYSDATYFTNMWSPLPRHAWSSFTALELLEAEESSRTPIGWGPYVIDEWLAGDRITLHKNENYFRADEGLPAFDNLIYRMVGENSNANVAALLAGDCDIVDQTSHLDDQSELLLELQASGQVNATFVTGTVFEHADFDIQPVAAWDGFAATGAFQNVDLRRSVAMCMDRQAVVDAVMFGQSVVLDTYLPPAHPQFNADARHYDFDVAAGSDLLESIGWVDDDGDPATPRVAAGVEGVADGTLLEFNFWTTNATQRQDATQIMAGTMAECGINALLDYWVPGEYFADGPEGPLFGLQYDLGQFAWLTGVEPPCDLYIGEAIPGDDRPYGWGGWNNTGFEDAEFDAACNAALQSLPGTPEYDANHLEAQRIWAEKLPSAPLYLRIKLAATRPDMTGFIMDPTANSEMWNIENFDYGQ